MTEIDIHEVVTVEDLLLEIRQICADLFALNPPAPVAVKLQRISQNAQACQGFMSDDDDDDFDLMDPS